MKILFWLCRLWFRWKKNCSERLAEGKMTSRGNLGTDLKGSLLIRAGYVRYSLCESVKFGYTLMARVLPYFSSSIAFF